MVANCIKVCYNLIYIVAFFDKLFSIKRKSIETHFTIKIEIEISIYLR
jgi:hypothetical protein